MVALKKVSDEELIAAFKTYGSPQKVSQVLGIDVGTVYRRRSALKDVSLPSFAARQHSIANTYIPDNRRVISHTVDNGHVFIASDCHYWPGEETVAHKAFVTLLTEFKPKTTVLNGDVFDGARISRHAALMGTNPLPQSKR